MYCEYYYGQLSIEEFYVPFGGTSASFFAICAWLFQWQGLVPSCVCSGPFGNSE
jgi:hypothetical protein